ncbi:unnamed protein product [Coregonus sp. 'balchen']|nr:unnamed protein product [Coregonus sp. 'balchen']
MTMILPAAASFWTSTIILLYLHSGDCAEIIDGKEVKPHSLPYMALLENKQGHKVCGGILIHQQWVLTAAHCSEKETRQVRKVKGRIPHPCYDRNIRVNDIMLLKLDKKVKPTKEVKALALPVPVADVPAGTQCSVSGWGATQNNAKTMSDVLRSTNVTGDSGGPLVCGSELRGVVSFGGKQCGIKNKPGVYTLMSTKYLDWINKTMRKSLID